MPTNEELKNKEEAAKKLPLDEELDSKSDEIESDDTDNIAGGRFGTANGGE